MRWRALARRPFVVITFAVLLVALGLLATQALSVTADPQTHKSHPSTTPRTSLLSPLDAAFLQTRINSQNLSVEAQAIVPTLHFAPGSAPILSPGTTAQINSKSFRSVGEYGVVTASTSDGHAFTLYLHHQSGHWPIWNSRPGLPVTTTSQVGGKTTPIPARLLDVQTSSTCISALHLGTRTPVVLVHGFIGRPGIWTTRAPGKSMTDALSRVPGLYVTAFDYSQFNTEWVDNNPIGPALATEIRCLADHSRQAGGLGKVIVVAHSMGGLATRYAASVQGTANDIGLVVTIATPNLGSGWARWWEDPFLEAFCISAVHMRPVTPGQSDQCPDFSALQGLAQHSSQIDKLPWLPTQISLHAIAGDETVRIGVENATLTDHLGGDFVVGVQSALTPGPNQSTTTTVACTSWYSPFGSCWHLGLPNNPQVEKETVTAIRAYLSNHRPAAGSPASPYAFWLTDHGLWLVHGSRLSLTASGSRLTGVWTWNAGGCDVTGSPGLICSASAPMSFSQVHGGLLGTFTANTTLTPVNGSGSFQPDAGAPKQGQTLILMFIAPNAAKFVSTSSSPADFATGNKNLCQTGSTPAQQARCGA
jgi:pimeloyl-ACP methyl ester carboxylesterase